MAEKNPLEKIAYEIGNCSLCQTGKSGKAVPGEGNHHAKIMFIGEAPGRREAETGRPFVGRSGTLLRKLIAEIGIQKKSIFITSVVKYLPDRGTPSSMDISHGKLHLDEQINVINPKYIILLGRVACQGVLGEHVAIKRMHGKIIEKNGKKYMVMYHPAAALRFPSITIILKKDFETLNELLQKANLR